MIATLGEMVRAARLAKGLSMGGLAKQLSVSVPFVSDVENGKRGIGVDKIQLWAAALGLDQVDLANASFIHRKNFELASAPDRTNRNQLGAYLMRRGWDELSEETAAKFLQHLQQKHPE
jgi:transcriptional regulator with XRE-family HTH domain